MRNVKSTFFLVFLFILVGAGAVDVAANIKQIRDPLSKKDGEKTLSGIKTYDGKNIYIREKIRVIEINFYVYFVRETLLELGTERVTQVLAENTMEVKGLARLIWRNGKTESLIFDNTGDVEKIIKDAELRKCCSIKWYFFNDNGALEKYFSLQDFGIQGTFSEGPSEEVDEAEEMGSKFLKKSRSLDCVKVRVTKSF